MLKIETIKTQDLKQYENNTKLHPKEQVEQIKNSITEFGFNDPIAIDEKTGVIIEGHGRFLAAQELGMIELPVIKLGHLSEAQRRAYMIAHNKLTINSGFDEELLKIEFNFLDDLNFDLDLTGFDMDELTEFLLKDDEPGDNENDDEVVKTLAERFIVPPFSVFDTRQGYWQDRKKLWKKIIGDDSVSREKCQNENIKISGQYKETGQDFAPNTSMFDPVVCEICYKWFCPENGIIIDPFAGGAVRGIVAGFLGYEYHGVDIREEQIAENYNKIVKNKNIINPVWYRGNSININNIISNGIRADFIFSCPPYYDLEKYSDDVNDISNIGWDDFKKQYETIIKNTLSFLKNDRFACFVIGDVRDKKGFYRELPEFTTGLFTKNNEVSLYNHIIIIDQIGSLPLRVSRYFSKNRKLGKMHQNILVFYKGDPKKIRVNFKEIIITDDELITKAAVLCQT